MKLERIVLGIIGSILATLLLSGCTDIASRQPMKVSIIGLDGATWEIIDPLIKNGELPGFDRLKKKGCTGFLKTYQPTESISIWTSIATGVTPTRHGLQSFTRRIPGTDKTIPSPGTDRQVPALWNITSEKGKKVVSVKWYATWPAEIINGAMLSPRLEPDTEKDRTYPPGLFKEINSFRYKSTADQLPQPPKQNPNLPIPDSSQPGALIGVDHVQTKMFDDTSVWQAGRYVYNKYQPDLFMIYLKSIDRVEHFLWGAQKTLSAPNPTSQEVQEAEVIFGWYRYFDSILLEMMKDPNRILVVVSDHGMHARSDVKDPYDVRYLNMDYLLKHIGYQLQISSTKTDWQNTRAYTYRNLPYDWTYQININLIGREPYGIVAKDQYQEIVNHLSTDLRKLNTMDGQSIFQSVSTGNSEYDISCSLNHNLKLDDVLVYQKNMIPLRSLLKTKGLPRGIHTKAPPGIIAVIGPGIRKNFQIENASVFDITPTILYAMDLPIAEDFDGKCLFGIFDESIISERPVKTIPSYGTRKTTSDLCETDADKRIKDELKALGYI